MRDEIALAVFASLAFLVPVACYCFILAIINRRQRPLLVPGVWDTVGLLAAGAGFFLATVPMLLHEFQQRVTGELASLRDFFDAPVRHWLIWSAYLLFLLTGCVWMFLWRMHKTMIYNVDTEHFSDTFKLTLAAVGLAIRAEQRGRMTLAAAASGEETGVTELPVRVAAPTATDARYAEVRIEFFPAFCHVTLHWDNYAAEVREQVETELAKTLTAPEDNPAAGWFLSISGLIFGVLFTIILVILITIWRWM